MSKLRLAGCIKESFVDGPGIRYVLFTQGCPHKCQGCHNPQTHDYEGGYLMDINDIYNDITRNPLVKGVTVSGGEPFNQANQVSELISKLKQNDYDVMVYTGYRYEDLYEKANENNGYMRLLESADILVDGKFELEYKNELIKFRGSENQRIIDCKETLRNYEVVTVEL